MLLSRSLREISTWRRPAFPPVEAVGQCRLNRVGKHPVTAHVAGGQTRRSEKLSVIAAIELGEAILGLPGHRNAYVGIGAPECSVREYPSASHRGSFPVSQLSQRVVGPSPCDSLIRASILLLSAFCGVDRCSECIGVSQGIIRAHSVVCSKISLFIDVAFLQQAPTNRATRPELRLSSVACSELLVSYRPATEGGIPRSSR